MKNRIKELRARCNLTQEELAKKAEVTRQTISSLEKGRYDPSIKLAFKLARIFETQIEDVFIYEE
ncbi:MAG: helix-turn-helix transcriptional regulator [Candidatus Hermodarchaeota archaeon]